MKQAWVTLRNLCRLASATVNNRGAALTGTPFARISYPASLDALQEEQAQDRSAIHSFLSFGSGLGGGSGMVPSGRVLAQR
jgi:hypothetical protein